MHTDTHMGTCSRHRHTLFYKNPVGKSGIVQWVKAHAATPEDMIWIPALHTHASTCSHIYMHTYKLVFKRRESNGWYECLKQSRKIYLHTFCVDFQRAVNSRTASRQRDRSFPLQKDSPL